MTRATETDENSGHWGWGTLVSSTKKTYHHDGNGVLWKEALNTKKANLNRFLNL